MTSTFKTILLAILALLLVWFAGALARVENERYGMSLGMCPFDVKSMDSQRKCLDELRTRSPMWNLFHALLP